MDRVNSEILAKATQEGRIVLTFDLDFGDLLALGLSDSPSVMIFRLHDETPASVIPRLMNVVDQAVEELDQGALVVVEDARYRLRRLPLKASE